MKLIKEDIVNAILDRLAWEDVMENIAETLERDLTDEEGKFVDEILQNLERLMDKYL